MQLVLWRMLQASLLASREVRLSFVLSLKSSCSGEATSRLTINGQQDGSLDAVNSRVKSKEDIPVIKKRLWFMI